MKVDDLAKYEWSYSQNKNRYNLQMGIAFK
jgi:hypothetical protein